MNALFQQHLKSLLAYSEADERDDFLERCEAKNYEEFVNELEDHIYYTFIVVSCYGSINIINDEINDLWYEYAEDNDISYDGKKSHDDRGYLCYWDDDEEDWIASEKHATPRFMTLLRGMKTFEGFHKGADDDTDDETTHEDFDTDTVICKSCNLPFYDLLDDGPFCNCPHSPPEPDHPPSDYCENI